MENQPEEHRYPLPGDDEIERASLEAAQRAISHVAAYQKNQRSVRLLKYVPVLKIAALVALVSSLTFFIYQKQKPVTLRTISVSARAGERKSVVLPDGSVAELNALSQLTYKENLEGKNRDISLAGEAFFKVKPDKQHPFIVHTGKLDVKVLGTSFNVKSYEGDARTRVTVATGKVSVQNRAQKDEAIFELLPGDQLIFDHTSAAFTRRKVASDEVADWQQQVLSFEFQTLREICAELERVYEVTFQLRNAKLAEKRFQLKVKNESLANILKLLSISGGGFPYQIENKTVTIN